MDGSAGGRIRRLTARRVPRQVQRLAPALALAAVLLAAWAGPAGAHGAAGPDIHDGLLAGLGSLVRPALELADGLLVVLALIIAGAPVRLAAARGPLPRLAPWLYAAGAMAVLLALPGLARTAPPPLHAARLAVAVLAPGAAAILARAAASGQRGQGRHVLAGALILALGVRALAHGPAVMAANLLHLAGAAAWLGALCWFGLWPGGEAERRRFANPAAWGLAFSVISGLMVALMVRGHGHAPNGPVLLAKHLLLVPVLALGWWHNRGRGGAGTIRLEALLGLGVLVLGVGLAKAPPGVVAPAAGAAALPQAAALAAQPEAAAAGAPAGGAANGAQLGQPHSEAEHAAQARPESLPGWSVTEAVPPTTGPLTAPAPGPGEYADPLSEPAQVAALARGDILIQYNCDCPDLVAEARRFRDQAPGRVILAPYPEMPSRLAFTAWGRIMVLDQWDGDLAGRFVSAFAGRGRDGAPAATAGPPPAESAESAAESAASAGGEASEAAADAGPVHVHEDGTVHSH